METVHLKDATPVSKKSNFYLSLLANLCTRGKNEFCLSCKRPSYINNLLVCSILVGATSRTMQEILPINISIDNFVQVAKVEMFTSN